MGVSLGAAVWARELYGVTATNFGFIAIGAAFRHPHPARGVTGPWADVVFVKTSARTYRTLGPAPGTKSRGFRTGLGTAVIPVEGVELAAAITAIRAAGYAGAL